MWLYVVLLTCALAYLYIWNSWRYWARRGVKGPPPSVLGMGHTGELINAFGVGAGKWSREYGDIFGVYFMFTKPTLIVNDPDIVKEICVKQFSRFTTRGRDASQKVIGKVANDLMTIVEGKRWKRIRSTITPFFTGSKLEEMAPILNSAASKALQDIIGPSATTGELVDVENFAEKFSMSAIMGCGFSIDAFENEDLMQAGLKHGRAALGSDWVKALSFMFIPERIRYHFNITMYPKATDKWFRYLTTSLLRNAEESRKKQEKTRPDFVTLMSEEIIPESIKETANKGFTKDEIFAQSLIFILAGFDTTADVIKFVLYNLAMNPVFQDELFECIPNDVKGEVTYKSLKNLKLLDATIKESQRLCTTAPMLGRECDEDTVVKGIHIEKGTLVFWDIVSIHHNEKYYVEPNKFNPHRFDGNESNTLQDDAWFGFGCGPRACPAVRWAYVAMKIFLVQVLQNYRIVKSNNTLNYDEWEMKLVGLSLRPSKPLLVNFEKR